MKNAVRNKRKISYTKNIAKNWGQILQNEVVRIFYVVKLRSSFFPQFQHRFALLSLPQLEEGTYQALYEAGHVFVCEIDSCLLFILLFSMFSMLIITFDGTSNWSKWTLTNCHLILMTYCQFTWFWKYW